MTVRNKRKDLFILFVSIILISLEISLISNIIFSSFFNDFKLVFSIILTLLTLFSIIVLVIIMFNYDLKKYSTQLLFAFDLKRKKFIDLNHNLTSVNARVLFENLSSKNKQKIKIDSIFDDNPEFLKFCNCLIIQLIFSRFLKNDQYKNSIKIDYLKDILVKFRYIDIDNILGGQKSMFGNREFTAAKLTLPNGFKLKKVENNRIEFDSSYGYVHFNWETSLSNNSETCALLTLPNKIESELLLGIDIILKMTYNFKALQIFKKSTLEFEQFIYQSKKTMDEFSKDNCLKEMNSKNLLYIIDYIDNKVK